MEESQAVENQPAAVPNGSHFGETTAESSSENDLLGFATPSAEQQSAVASSDGDGGELLDFSTPPESAENLLDFAAAPETSAQQEPTTTAGGAVQDLLGFATSPQENSFASPPQEETTVESSQQPSADEAVQDLLDFGGSSPPPSASGPEEDTPFGSNDEQPLVDLMADAPAADLDTQQQRPSTDLDTEPTAPPSLTGDSSVSQTTETEQVEPASLPVNTNVSAAPSPFTGDSALQPTEAAEQVEPSDASLPVNTNVSAPTDLMMKNEAPKETAGPLQAQQLSEPTMLDATNQLENQEANVLLASNESAVPPMDDTVETELDLVSSESQETEPVAPEPVTNETTEPSTVNVESDVMEGADENVQVADETLVVNGEKQKEAAEDSKSPPKEETSDNANMETVNEPESGEIKDNAIPGTTTDVTHPQQDEPTLEGTETESITPREADVESGDRPESDDDPPTETDDSPTDCAEPSPTMVDIPLSENDESNSNEQESEKDVIIVELQESLQYHLTKQAEAEDRERQTHERMKKPEQELQAKAKVEKELVDLKENLKTVVSDKANLELELAKLRRTRDEHERKEIVLSNRLNAAKKKEAVKANLAEQLEDEVKVLQTELSTTKEKLGETETGKEEAEHELQETKRDMSKRVQQAETALADERRLNEDRKKKMKAFIETKQEEVRQGKVHSDELTAELEQTNRLLREQNSRWKQLHAQWVQSQTRNRELQRDLNRIKKDSDNMHKIGDKMEMRLSRSAQETEEHKSKRLTAKHELMTVLRTLEGEREVCSKLRDSLKFTFTPKALSQQQLLKESLQDFERELESLSRRLGRQLPPPTDSPVFSADDASDENTEGVATVSSQDETDGEGSILRNRSEIDSNHLISNLENETQRVSQCIMALMSSIERMHVILEESGTQSCMTALSGLLSGGSGSASTADTSSEERSSMTGGGGLPGLRTRSARYGQVPTS